MHSMWPFRKQPNLELLDAEFGWIDYEHGVWCSILDRNPSEFMVTIHAGENGPTELQRNFYRAILADLSRLCELGLAFVSTDAFEPVDIGTLGIYSVAVGRGEDCEMEKFVMEFSDKQADLIHVAWLEQGKLVVYGCDD